MKPYIHFKSSHIKLNVLFMVTIVITVLLPSEKPDNWVNFFNNCLVPSSSLTSMLALDDSLFVSLIDCTMFCKKWSGEAESLISSNSIWLLSLTNIFAVPTQSPFTKTVTKRSPFVLQPAKIYLYKHVQRWTNKNTTHLTFLTYLIPNLISLVRRVQLKGAKLFCTKT